MALKPRFPRVENRYNQSYLKESRENHMWFKYHEGKRASASVAFFFSGLFWL